ncbi:MAG: diguanylate cyclase [Gemmatimonadales bacterium]
MTTTTPSGGAAEFFEELRREYLLEAAARLGELRKDLAALKSGETDAATSLKVRFHRLAGSGGSYGFPEISTRSRAAERWLAEHPSPAATEAAILEELVGAIAQAFDAAGATLGLPQSAPKPATFGWQSMVIGSPGDLADRVHTTLVDAHYSAQHLPIGADPASIPVSERPDVVVILAGEGEEAAEAVQRWAAPSPLRPTSVILVAAADQIDPLRKPFASVDSMVSPDRVETELLAAVRTLGRAATAPRSVLVVDRDDQEGTRALISALEGVQVRVLHAGGGFSARDLLGSEAPDLIVVDWRLGDTTAGALIRWIRRQPAHRLTPVVVSLAAASDEDSLGAIRAGADDAFIKTGSPGHLSQLLMARIERSRAVRTLAHRDDLTGLLNHEVMAEELERALSLARRTSEPLAFLIVDLDHFRRINEQYGSAGGDSALVHVARLVGGTVRSSDLVARMGGEEFGVLVRRCLPADAVRVAEKIHRAIGGTPVVLPEGSITIRVSVGVACYPDHGTGAADMLRAADKALAAAKSGGRDRVVVAS